MNAMGTPQRWKITIEYDGTQYYGWQIQKDLPTIQGALQDALQKFRGQNIEVIGSGRTDAGVHAYAQVAHFDMIYSYANPKRQNEPREIDGHELAKAINAHLHDHPIRVLNAKKIDSDFHARFSSTQKTYAYKILSRPAPSVLHENRYWHIPHELDINAMNSAAKILLGQHDFTTFRDGECQAQSPIRTLDVLNISSEKTPCGYGEIVIIHTQAKSYLHHMVRNIAGSLKAVGQGKWNTQDLKDALNAKDRKRGGQTAPACGLYMVHVDYD